MDLESTVSAWRQIEINPRSIAIFRTFEGLQALGVLSQSAKAEVLETHDSTVGNASQIHRVVPYIMVVLHPLVAVRATRHKTSVASRVILIRRQAEDLEALGSHFGTGIDHSIGRFGRPFVVSSIGVIARNPDYATLGNGFLVPCNLHRGDHWLAGEAKATRRTMIEHIPLAVDLLERAVGVVGGIGGNQVRAILTRHHATGVYQHTTRAPRT